MHESAYYSRSSGFIDWLKQLIEEEVLEDAALGITKQFIAKGWESLSDKQKFVFERDVIEPNIIKECAGREHEIPLDDMYDARNNGGFCNDCHHDLSKQVWRDD